MILIPKTRVKAENVCDEIDSHTVVCGMTHPYHMWSKPHITLVIWWNTISIPVKLSLNTTLLMMRTMVKEALGSNIQCNS